MMPGTRRGEYWPVSREALKQAFRWAGFPRPLSISLVSSDVQACTGTYLVKFSYVNLRHQTPDCLREAVHHAFVEPISSVRVVAEPRRYLVYFTIQLKETF
jgi:hypothetical protein